jgi:benzoyl-CoA reductase/2-hydroxyglutaryl-CoA dehydratase subunit BcrC/BadD/HgdB
LSPALEQIRRRYERRDADAREWSSRGGKVVAYMCDNFPSELVAAADMLPFRLDGDPAAASPNVARYIAPDRNPISRVPAFADAMLESLVAGDQEFVDYVVVPHGRKAIESSYQLLTGARAAGAPIGAVELFYLDKSYLRGFSSSVFDRECVLALKTQLEEWSGAPVTDAALTKAIEDANRGRALLARVNRLRIGESPRLSGADALRLYSLAGAVTRSAHNEMVERVLADVGQMPERGGPRVYLAGSPQPTPALYELIESLGVTVVGEDHCWGARTAGCPTPLGPSPLEALSERYHETPVCSIEFPLERALSRWQTRVRLARPDGVIVYVVEDDELHVWDSPDRMRLLAADRVPSLHLPRQAADPDLEELRETIGAWLARLRR